MATGRVKKENEMTVGVVLVLTRKEADYLKGYLHNQFYTQESIEQSHLRRDIFEAIPPMVKTHASTFYFDEDIPF